MHPASPLVAALAAACALAFAASAASAQITNATIPYQGRLDNNGEPFTGTVDLNFQFFSEPVDGNPLGGPVLVENVDVIDGLFMAEIPFDSADTGPEKFWIQISIDGTVLQPRQPYHPAASSVQSAAAEIGPTETVIFTRTDGSAETASNIVSFTGSTTLPSIWQSFTPTVSGPLSGLEIAGVLAIGDTPVFRVYEGEGTSGALLFEGNGQAFSASFLISLEDGPQVSVGQSYTVEAAIIDAATQLPGGATWRLVETNTYLGGIASTNRNDDLQFDFNVRTPGPAQAFVTKQGTLTLDGQLSVRGFDSQFSDDVALPPSSIDSGETSEEPGLTSNTVTSVSAVSSFPSFTQIMSRSISVPGPGYVFASFTGEFEVNHVTGITSSHTIGLSASPSSLSSSQDFQSIIPSAYPSGLVDRPYAVQSVFRVTTAGTYPVYVLGLKDSTASPSGLFNDVNLTLMYFPTAYGTASTAGTLTQVTATDAPDLNPENQLTVFPADDERSAVDPIIQAEFEEALRSADSPD